MMHRRRKSQTNLELDNVGMMESSTSSIVSESPDSFKSSRKVFGKLWSTAKHKAKLLTTPHSSQPNRNRSASLTPRQINFGDGQGNGFAGSLDLRSFQDRTFDDRSLQLDGLDASSLLRKRGEIEKLKKDTSFQLQRELLKHQKQLILTSEMISDLHKNLSSLRKCVTSMKSILPLYHNLNASSLDLDLEEALQGGGGVATEGGSNSSNSNKKKRNDKGRDNKEESERKERFPSVASRGGGSHSDSDENDDDDDAILYSLAEQDIGRIITHLQELKESRSGGGGGGGDGEGAEVSFHLEEMQMISILAIASDILEDDNSSAEEIELSIRCVSLISSPGQARRLLLQRYTNLLRQPVKTFQKRKEVDLPDFLPNTGAFSSTFLSIIRRAASDCREYFGKTDNRWSSDLLCWCMDQVQLLCTEIQKSTLSFISSGGELVDVVELVCVVLAESTIVGRDVQIALVMLLEDNLTSMLMTAIGVYLPKVGQNVALQATAEIAQYIQILEGTEDPSKSNRLLYNRLSDSTSMMATTLENLLQHVSPLLTPALQMHIANGMLSVFKQYINTISDSVKRYASFIKKEVTEKHVNFLKVTRAEMFANIKLATTKIVNIKGDPTVKEQIDSEILRFRKVYNEAFSLSKPRS